MANNLKLADNTANAQADALARRLDNGYCRIYEGTHTRPQKPRVTGVARTAQAAQRTSATAEVREPEDWILGLDDEALLMA